MQTLEQFAKRYQYDPSDKADRLGAGGFGQVFKAYDTVKDEEVAIKIATVKDNFNLQQEVETAKSIPPHRNIAHYETCYRFSSPTGITDFGILKYYELGNLSQLIQNNSLSTSEKEHIAKGIVDGIAHLHANNVVHRDLKSPNILVARDKKGNYIPKIADFGLSKAFGGSGSAEFSNSFAGGSMTYTAPEQLEGKAIRKNVDLWPLGIILFELFTGAIPFTLDETGASTRGARVDFLEKVKDSQLPKSVNSIPEPWNKVIRKCVIYDQKKRIQNIKELKTMLKDEPKTHDSLITTEQFKDDKTAIVKEKARNH